VVRIREGSPVEVQWAIWWVEEDLWICGIFVEQVSSKSGMEWKREALRVCMTTLQ